MVCDLTFLLQNGSRPCAGGYRARCPIHGSDHQYSLAVDVEKGVFFCHACGASGRVAGSTTRSASTSSSAVARNLAPVSVFQRPQNSHDVPDPVVRSEVLCRVLDLYIRQFPGSPAERYLQSRGVPAELARKMGAGWADGRLVHHAGALGLSKADLQAAGLLRADGREVLAGRVVFALTRDHVVVNFYGRAVDANVAKPWMHRFLRGPRGVFNEPGRWSEACLCEGVLDALSAMACGYPFATALCGLHGVDATDETWKNLENVVLALDEDAAGQARRETLAEAFWQSGKQVFLLEGLGAKDLNQAWQMAGALPDLQERAPLLPEDAWNRVGLREIARQSSPVHGRETRSLPAMAPSSAGLSVPMETEADEGPSLTTISAAGKEIWHLPDVASLPMDADLHLAGGEFGGSAHGDNRGWPSAGQVQEVVAVLHRVADVLAGWAAGPEAVPSADGDTRVQHLPAVDVGPSEEALRLPDGGFPFRDSDAEDEARAEIEDSFEAMDALRERFPIRLVGGLQPWSAPLNLEARPKKPFAKRVTAARAGAGATLRGDGKILVFDEPRVLRRARAMGERAPP